MSQSLASLADSIRNAIPNLKSDQPQTVDAFFARRLIDKNEAVKIDPDDLATTLANLLASTGARAALIAALVGGTAAGQLDSVEVLTAARTLTAADSHKTFFLDLAGGFTVTLPAVTAGFRCEILVKTAPTTDYIVAAHANNQDTIIGKVIASTGGDEDSEQTAGGDVANFVAGASKAGDSMIIRCDGTYWYIDAFVDVTGSVTITG